MDATPRNRLVRSAARDLYVRAGEAEAFRQMKRDAESLDAMELNATNSSDPQDHPVRFALGPFARVRADEVVRSLDKTRGAINNVWRNQETFQAAVMSYSLDASAQDGLGMSNYNFPDPATCADIFEWINHFAEAELRRGPRHGMEPTAAYALRWAAWLGLVPYALWSEVVAEESLIEYRLGVEQHLSALLMQTLECFDLRLRDDTSMTDLAVATASIVEGVWLNACCTLQDPVGRNQTLADSLATSLTILIRGATVASSRRDGSGASVRRQKDQASSPSNASG